MLLFGSFCPLGIVYISLGLSLDWFRLSSRSRRTARITSFWIYISFESTTTIGFSLVQGFIPFFFFFFTVGTSKKSGIRGFWLISLLFSYCIQILISVAEYIISFKVNANNNFSKALFSSSVCLNICLWSTVLKCYNLCLLFDLHFF